MLVYVASLLKPHLNKRKRMEAVEQDTKPWVEVIDSENRRRYPRFEIHLPIEYFQLKPSITHTGNISEGGLLIYLAEATDVSQYLRLKLFISLGSELNTIEVLAEVVWTDNHLSKDQEYYPCGVKFVDISPEDDAKLKNVLKKLSSPLDKKLSQKTNDNSQLFTHRELEVLNLIAVGYNDNEIAGLLHTNGRIIQQDKSNILGKTNLPDISSAIQYALEKELLRIACA